MRELIRTNDLVLLSYASHVLEEEGITPYVFDNHMSAMEGSIGALPRRLMVEEDDFARAATALSNASITLSSS
ncbi:MAG TPA: DUF2007 domain-containing protein [Aestuariivirgaceae bacterium]|nr:DUF2007 domain-containing protein [Aestuariivirgaceae bacterium]